MRSWLFSNPRLRLQSEGRRVQVEKRQLKAKETRAIAHWTFAFFCRLVREANPQISIEHQPRLSSPIGKSILLARALLPTFHPFSPMKLALQAHFEGDGAIRIRTPVQFLWVAS